MKQALGHAAVRLLSLLIPEPPRGLKRLAWVGPGFLWMVSAAGSGELLFTPRIGALYGYALLWAMISAVALKWLINREIGRFAVCTGQSIVEGFATLPGPRHWAVWCILAPQVLVAIAAIAGLAGSAATALVLMLPGDLRLWMVTSVLASTVLVVFGRYSTIERVATAIGVALGVASVIAASTVVSSFRTVAAGLRPAFPPETDYGEVLPWLGFMLSGAAGMMWYSYWLVEKKYGMAGVNPNSAASPKSLRAADRTRLRGWIAQMTVDNTVAVIGTLAVVAAFLVLGTELLRPQRLIPEEDQIANTLGRLLGSVWGPIGFWFMVVAVFVGFWDTVLADQDGHGRLFANGTRILLQKHGLRGRFSDDMLLRRLFVLVLVSACPIALYLTIGQPVRLLKFAGAVEAAHIPLVTALTPYLNHRTLPEDLRPSWPIAVATGIAGLFFLVFAGFYVVQLPS